MRGGEHVEHVLAGIKGGIAFNTVNHLRQTMENLDARLLEFGTHRDGKRAADGAGDDCKNQVQGTDVFMIGRVYPTNPAMRLVVVVGTMLVSCCASHGIRSRFSSLAAASARKPIGFASPVRRSNAQNAIARIRRRAALQRDLQPRRSHLIVRTAFAFSLQKSLVCPRQIRRGR
ncbi:Uncharacterised protein [Brucella melitensis]|nr:Uncharacterised protein [Brucella melitensis]